MAPGTHAVIGWWTANVFPLSRRDRLLVFLGGVLPDLDGLGLLTDKFWTSHAYQTYHHVLCHNLFVGLLWAGLAAGLAQAALHCGLLALLNWHVHLACDYFGSRGPMSDPPWVLPYLYPLVGDWHGLEVTGPSWYWNRWQWPLNSWPNLLTTLVFFAGWLYIAVRLNRTWFEFISLRLDRGFCATLRKWFGAQPSETWSPREGWIIRRVYLLGVVAAFFACVVAAVSS
jgi:hypothetical protein